MIRVYRPDGECQRLASGKSAPVVWSSRLRVGILDNLKPNAGLLMRLIADAAVTRLGGAVTTVQGKSAARPAPANIIEQLRLSTDVVITGSGD